MLLLLLLMLLLLYGGDTYMDLRAAPFLMLECSCFRTARLRVAEMPWL